VSDDALQHFKYTTTDTTQLSGNIGMMSGAFVQLCGGIGGVADGSLFYSSGFSDVIPYISSN
jgi:hypothetical protein